MSKDNQLARQGAPIDEEDARLEDKAFRWLSGRKSVAQSGFRDEHGKVSKGAELFVPAVELLKKLLVEVRDEERERCARIVEDWASSSFPGSEDALISRGNAARLIEEKIRA
jgi:hypothetical protein